MTHDMTPGEMRECLDALSWSQTMLAMRLGIEERRVSDWVRGRRDMPPNLADWLRRSAASLRAEPLPEGW